VAVNPLLKERSPVKIQVVKKGEQKLSSMHVCPWYIDEPPPAKK
jgi:hypothetical protein